MRPIFALSFCTGMFAVTISTARAADWTVSANSCQEERDNGAGAKYGTNGVSNKSTATRALVYCPVVCEDTNFDCDDLPQKLELYVNDQATASGTNYEFQCGLRYRSRFGTLYLSSSLSSANGFSTLTWIDPFGQGPLDLLGLFSAYCYIPVKYNSLESYLIGLRAQVY